jgi:hypothetical protein
MAKAHKPKATTASAKPKPKFTDKAESERFIETARKLGIESTDDFDRAFKSIIDKKRSTSL